MPHMALPGTLRNALPCLMLVFAQAIAQAQPSPPSQGPQAARIPHDVSIHGDPRIDEYHWLRNRDDPKVVAHLKAEAAHTEAWFQPLAQLTERLYQEMLARIQQTDEAVPLRDGKWWYSSQTETGKQYPILVRRLARGPDRSFSANAPAQVLLDLNQMAQGLPYLSLGSAIPSPDGKLLAYSVDTTGDRDYRLRIREIATGRDLGWSTAGVSSFAWSADSRQLFYTRQNKALRSDTFWRHSVGQPAGAEVLIFRETDELFTLHVGTADDQRHLVLTSYAKDTTEQRLLDAQRAKGTWQVVLPRKRGIEYYAAPHEGKLILRINDRGPNFRLLRTGHRHAAPHQPMLQPEALASATELVPHRIDASLDAIRLFRTHLVLQVREGGSVKLKVMRHRDLSWREIGFQEPAYVANLDGWRPRYLNLEYASKSVRLTYSSLITPPTVYEASLEDGRLQLLKREPILGGYDPSQLGAERLLARAPDGTDVPVSVVFSRAHRLTGPRPLLLTGYGSYGVPNDPRFRPQLLPLLERGVIVAIAHVRGGGDLGRHWYQQGKLEHKMNTFTDFIAVAEHLVSTGYTDASRLIISGGSAGGLLMGAVTNLRPDLFRAVVADVPFVDVINTMLDESLPLTQEEFIEWGNPKVAREYAWMRAYSPYDNLKPGAYPAVLALTALHDSQVPYWEAAKYVARLRALKTNDRPVLLDINMQAGHAGASGRYDALRERARIHAFMLSQWGLTESAPASGKP